ncbi:MAG: pyrroline-5-carboxylate reductase [Myxococcota bacterium]
MLKTKQIAFLGVGNMGRAIVEGLLREEVVDADHVWVADKHAELCEVLHRKWSVQTGSIQHVVPHADIVILAVKPQDIAQLLTEIAPTLHSEQLVISIAAGVSTQTIESYLEPSIPVVRVMPNLPMQIGAGAAAYCLGAHASWPHGVVCSLLCSAMGIAVEVSEDQMDAVTALSGTGPAYVFLLAEALTQAGIQEGLPQEVAHYLTTQTLLGGAKMMMNTEVTPAALRQQVTSPNGPTAAAMEVFERHGFHDIVQKGVHAARTRARVLCEHFSSTNLPSV